MDKEHLYDGNDNKEDITMSTKPVQVMEPNAVVLGPDSTILSCPHCGSSVKTRVKHTITTRTHVAAALCGLICCCCCIPYCSQSAKNTDHFCPSCYKYLGTYEK